MLKYGTNIVQECAPFQFTPNIIIVSKYNLLIDHRIK